MIENFNRHSLRDLLIATLCSLFIYFTSIYFIPFLFIVFPAPFIVLGVKRGIQHSLLSVLVACLVIYLLDGLGSVLLMGAMAVFVAIPMIICIKRGFSAFTTIGISTAIGIVFVFIVSMLISQSSGIDILNSLEVAITKSIDEQIQVMKNLQILQDDDLQGMMKSSIAMMMAIIPSLLFIMTMLISMLNYYTSASMLRRIGFGIMDVPKFYNFRLPKDIVFGALIMGVGTFVLSLLGMGYITEISLNLTLAFSFLFMLQGLAAVIQFLRRRMRPAPLYTLLFISLLLGVRIIYVIIGVLYSVLNVRIIQGGDEDEK